MMPKTAATPTNVTLFDDQTLPFSIDKTKRQRPSFFRVDNPLPFHLTHRDQQIILRVAYYRLLTTHHIEACLFRTDNDRGLKSQCQRRLQLLYHHRFLNRIQQPVVLGDGRKPFIYVLDKRGVNVVAQLLDISTSEVDWNPKLKDRTDPYRLQHDLHISDTWVILDGLVRGQQLQMPYWLTQHKLNSTQFKDKLPRLQDAGQKKSKVPDGYFALQIDGVPELAHFFYEEDRGTQSQKQWSEKVRGYVEYKERGESYRHFGCRNFRVLTKTTTLKRLANLKKWTESAGGNQMFWFTTVDRVDIWQPETFLQPIWQVAMSEGEYPLKLTSTTNMTMMSST